MVILSSTRLQAEIAEPGEFYKGSRYDWSGHVKQVTLDGKHTFFSTQQDPPDASLQGCGLLDVFETPDFLGFEETELNNRFPLLGVGLLKKESREPFLFRYPYDVLPFEHHIEKIGNTVTFITLPTLCNGYGLYETKKLILEDTSLTISYALENTGSREINFATFNHNFFQIDNHPINGDYNLILPYQVSLRTLRGSICAQYQSVSVAAFDKPTASGAFFINGFEGSKRHWWKLRYLPENLEVFCEESFPVSRLYVWVMERSFSPETFFKTCLPPGERCSLLRKYTFNRPA
jgi:hypothetical protein